METEFPPRVDYILQRKIIFNDLHNAYKVEEPPFRRLNVENLEELTKQLCKKYPPLFTEKKCKFNPHINLAYGNNSWEQCRSASCSGNKHNAEQIFCIACRKWFHKDCIPEKENFNVTFYVCPPCCTSNK